MIKIDKEFKSLIPPLTDEEYKQLEENILRDGIREPLVMWHVPNGDDILIDGHNRYKISQSHSGISFQTSTVEFANRDEAIVWIINNQLGKRNISKFDRITLEDKKKEILAKRAEEKKLSTLKQNADPEVKKSCPREKQTRKEKRQNSTDYKIAKAADTSEDTVRKVRKINELATDKTKQLVRDGKLSINEAYNSVHPKQPHVANNSGNNEWYTPAEYIEAAREVMGSIDLDPASNELANKTVKAQTFYTAEINGLNKEWFGNVWLNPPYSASLVQAFAEKVISSNFQQAVILVNNATDTAWFRKLIEKANAILFTTGRIRFYKTDGEKGAPLQGQAFIYYGDSVEKFLEVFSKFGWGARL